MTWDQEWNPGSLSVETCQEGSTREPHFLRQGLVFTPPTFLSVLGGLWLASIENVKSDVLLLGDYVFKQ
jgi:hypothetical protein